MKNTSVPNRDEVKGDIRQVTGTVKETIGRAAGDTGLEARGALEVAAGHVQADFGKAKRKASGVLKDLGDKVNR